MRKWFVDDVFIRHGRVYDRGYIIREDGYVEWTEPVPNGRTFEFPVSECFHPAGWLSFEPGEPIMVEDGELLGELCTGWAAVQRVEFVVDARRYFEVDAERLDQVEDGDEVLVAIDFSERRATYVWYGAGENPANFTEEEDDFEAVVDRFKREIIESIENI